MLSTGSDRLRTGVRVNLSLLAIIVVLLFSLQGHSIAASPMVPSAFEGFHDGADCTHIFGWAWDANDPNNAIAVDIYADNVLVTSAAADQFRQDLLDAGIGNGAHGFDIATPNSLKDGQPHSIRIAVSGTSINLHGTPKTINCSGPVYEGFFDVATCNVISGWAWDGMQPDTPINVDVYFDNNVARSILAPANQFRQDLLDAGKGNGVHGFSFPTPSFLRDGHPHAIRIKFTGTSQDLFNSPMSITCSTNLPASFVGFHDGADCNEIFGWAWDSNHPDLTVSVDIYSDNVLIATVAANQFRQDLLNAGIGDGTHAFSFATPLSLKDGQNHTIGIGFHDTDLALFNTFRIINCQ